MQCNVQKIVQNGRIQSDFFSDKCKSSFIHLHESDITENGAYIKEYVLCKKLTVQNQKVPES